MGVVDPRGSIPQTACRKKLAAPRRPNALRNRINESVLDHTRLGDERWIGQAGSLGAERLRSLLLVLLVLLVVLVAVIVGVSRHAMRLVDLIVPQLAIGAVFGEQLGMGAALDRPAP